MNRVIVGLLLAYGISIGHLAAQNKVLDSLSRTSYVERFTRHFFIWPVLKQRNVSFSIQNSDQSQKLTFKPNVSYHAGMGFYIFGVGMQLVFALPASSASDQVYGHSSAFDLQANILGQHWGVDLFTQNYKGYYAEDKNIPLNSDAPRPQRKDITTWNNGFNGIYFFNKRRYSLRSTYNYYERQLKSAGSIITSVNANTFSLRADSVLLNPYYESVFGKGANVQRLDFTTFSIAPGYAYTFVVRKTFFIGCAVAYGPSLNWLRYNSGSEAWKSVAQVNSFLDLRLSTGYNAKRFFCGVSFIHQTRNVGYEGVVFSNSNDAFKFALGYRFVEVGILKRRAFDIFRPKSSL
jgi:hypothetical protein